MVWADLVEVLQGVAVPPGVGKMKCPICNAGTLVEKSYKNGKFVVDRCTNCEGIWFDKDELHTLLGMRSAGYFEIPRISQQNNRARCPKCDVGMYELCYPGTTVFIDMCKSCHGIWLDKNEWSEINTARTRNPVNIKLSENDKKNSTPEKVEPSNTGNNSYTDDIPGIKGSLLRFIENSIDYLTDY